MPIREISEFIIVAAWRVNIDCQCAGEGLYHKQRHAHAHFGSSFH